MTLKHSRHENLVVFTDRQYGDNMKITGEKIIEAISLNGYPQGFLHMLETDTPDKNILNACAVGQGALNIGCTFPSLTAALEKFFGAYVPVFNLNDYERKTPKQIARLLKKSAKDYGINLSEGVEVDAYDWGHYYENYQGKKV